jgi:hypothetical protein
LLLLENIDSADIGLEVYNLGGGAQISNLLVA